VSVLFVHRKRLLIYFHHDSRRNWYVIQTELVHPPAHFNLSFLSCRNVRLVSLNLVPVISLDSLRHTPPPCPARSNRPRPCRRTPATGFSGAPVAVSSVPDATSHHVRRHRRAALPSTASFRPILRQSMTAPRLLSPLCRWARVPAPRAHRYIPRLLQLAALPPLPTQPPPLHDCPSVLEVVITPYLIIDATAHQTKQNQKNLRARALTKQVSSFSSPLASHPSLRMAIGQHQSQKYIYPLQASARKIRKLENIANLGSFSLRV
jgi:hypothetical protein